MALNLSRYALFALIGLMIVLLLREWNNFSDAFDDQREQALLEKAQLAEQQIPTSSASESSVPGAADIHSLPSEVVATASTPLVSTAVQATNTNPVVIETKALRITIDPNGAQISQIELLKHLTTLDEDGEPLKLLEKNPLRTYTAFDGVISAENQSSENIQFSSVAPYYSLEEGGKVTLTATMDNNVVVEKTFTVTSESYEIDSAIKVINNSDQEWKGRYLAEIRRDNSEDPGVDDAPMGMRSYLGTATTNSESPYHKISFKDIAKENYRSKESGGWVAMIQHYFVSAWIPDQTTEHTFYTRLLNQSLNTIGLIDNTVSVSPGQAQTFKSKFYAGPKDQYRMGALAENLELTVDYGFLWWLSQPLYVLLYFFATGELHIFDNVYKLFPGFQNWGLAIIALTIVVKALFFKLSAASYRSMANMRRVQPKLMALRERHENDRAAQSKAMMELYQKEKINPLGGCLPILVQMPVFIALYWALIESVELRHAPFFLWIKDLSVMDPLFILPILMGASMWFQQRMNPAPPDPMQAKVMQWMPIIFTFFFLWFPAGLVIYWVSNNILSITQQWYITRKIEQENAATS